MQVERVENLFGQVLELGETFFDLPLNFTEVVPFRSDTLTQVVNKNQLVTYRRRPVLVGALVA